MAESELDGGVSNPSKATLIIRPARSIPRRLAMAFFKLTKVFSSELKLVYCDLNRYI
jgi:hypothetical protein